MLLIFLVFCVVFLSGVMLLIFLVFCVVVFVGVRVTHLISFLCCVFCFVCLPPVSCVLNNASVSRLSILDCPGFGFI